MEHFINNILGKMTGVAKPQKKFLVSLFLTILLMEVGPILWTTKRSKEMKLLCQFRAGKSALVVTQ